MFIFYAICIHNLPKSNKKIAKKIKIDAQICGHDKAVFWESFQKCKHVNKLLM